MEVISVLQQHDHVDELIIKVFQKYDMHLSAKAISRTIWKCFEETVSSQSIMRHMEHLPCDSIDATVKKYYLDVPYKIY